MKKHPRVRCVPRADGAMVHRTRPLSDERGRHIGNACDCRKVITTDRSRQSEPHEMVNGLIVARRAHQERVQAVSR